MAYYVGKMSFGDNHLSHYGVLGMKWGVRKQPNDGIMNGKNSNGKVDKSPNKQSNGMSKGKKIALSLLAVAGAVTVLSLMAHHNEMIANAGYAFVKKTLNPFGHTTYKYNQKAVESGYHLLTESQLMERLIPETRLTEIRIPQTFVP